MVASYMASYWVYIPSVKDVTRDSGIVLFIEVSSRAATRTILMGWPFIVLQISKSLQNRWTSIESPTSGQPMVWHEIIFFMGTPKLIPKWDLIVEALYPLVKVVAFFDLTVDTIASDNCFSSSSVGIPVSSYALQKEILTEVWATFKIIKGPLSWTANIA